MSFDKSVKKMTIGTFKNLIKGMYQATYEKWTIPPALNKDAMNKDKKWLEEINKLGKTNSLNKKQIDKKINTEHPNYYIKLVKQYDNYLNSAFKKLQAFYIHGSPGIGKSQSVKQLANELGIDFRDVRLTTLDPVDLRGLPMIDKEKMVARWLQAGFLPDSNSKMGGILLIDEINAVPPTMQAAAYQLVLEKEIGDYKLPPKWLVIVAGNKMSDKAITYKLPSPLANRFTHIELKVNVSEWIKWAENNNIDIFVINLIRLGLNNPDSSLIKGKVLSLLFDFENKNDLAFPTPRTWEFVSNLAPLRDSDFKIYMDAVYGTIGEKAGSMLYQFIMHRDQIPNIENLLKGMSYDMPLEMDTQYVMNSAILQALEKQPTVERLDNYITNYIIWFENKHKKDMVAIIIFDLLDRFNKEFNHILLGKSKEFQQLIRRNSELIFSR